MDTDTTAPEVRELFLDLISRVQGSESISSLLGVRDMFSSEAWQRALEHVDGEASSPEIERRNIERVARILTKEGWTVEREVWAADRAFRVDLLVTHPDISSWGHIEVKDSVGPSGKEYVDAVKQAADYVGCSTADGRAIEWGAVYPVRFAHLWNGSRSEVSRDERLAMAPVAQFISGVFELASKHFKVHALFHAPRHDRPRGDALTLMYLNRHRIWQEGVGFAGNAESYLCGKRQVGGTRK